MILIIKRRATITEINHEADQYNEAYEALPASYAYVNAERSPHKPKPIKAYKS